MFQQLLAPLWRGHGLFGAHPSHPRLLTQLAHRQWSIGQGLLLVLGRNSYVS